MVLLSDYGSSVSMSAEDLDESNGIENEIIMKQDMKDH